MGDIINLRRFHKTKARAASQEQAAANRTLHGRTKAEKASTRAEKERRERALDGAKLDKD